ncbi:hypothetical protein FHX15_003412 [Rhizobium sp. BK650]|nr:hypothetical protein [Rhizobium sp. BK650]
MGKINGEIHQPSDAIGADGLDAMQEQFAGRRV